MTEWNEKQEIVVERVIPQIDGGKFKRFLIFLRIFKASYFERRRVRNGETFLNRYLSLIGHIVTGRVYVRGIH